jgi:hypothetical protein
MPPTKILLEISLTNFPTSKKTSPQRKSLRKTFDIKLAEESKEQFKRRLTWNLDSLTLLYHK